MARSSMRCLEGSRCCGRAGTEAYEPSVGLRELDTLMVGVGPNFVPILGDESAFFPEFKDEERECPAGILVTEECGICFELV